MKPIIKNFRVHGYYGDNGSECYWDKPMSIFRFYRFRRTVKKYLTLNNKTTMKAEENKALEFLKSKHNGEIPYKFGRNEMARWMNEYACTKVEKMAIEFAMYTHFPQMQTMTYFEEKFKEWYNQYKDNE